MAQLDLNPGHFEASETPKALCIAPPAVPFSCFLWCDRTHCPAGVTSVTGLRGVWADVSKQNSHPLQLLWF